MLDRIAGGHHRLAALDQEIERTIEERIEHCTFGPEQIIGGGGADAGLDGQLLHREIRAVGLPDERFRGIEDPLAPVFFLLLPQHVRIRILHPVPTVGA